MEVMDKIWRYIDNTKISNGMQYAMQTREMTTLRELSPLDGIATAFYYGRAKGYRAAKAQQKKGRKS
ncbi:hypothetical protein AAK912_11415 [Merdimmobilis hominis]|uniref:hypothetical protein n=1 Tax=Merdimmobilis hominis TaxID=2897707 RepID=UPI003519133E